MKPLNKVVTAAAVLLAFMTGAHADSLRIVALGASNTAGKGVGQTSAWPAQLQAMLRVKGFDATVSNAGIGGDDTSRMVARLSNAVPEGTQLVIMEKAASNDRKRGVDTEGNVSAIRSQLSARHIKLFVIPGMHGWANRQLQADGIHITANGHRTVAAKLMAPVTRMIGKD